ncbi:MAG TPA: hypothetical protein ENJ51_03375 [Leucothrix mucor]|uniref:DUF3619 family protein n=1 Tax=Leucothrix mucor TaxID=45248 RepID=A0A7V2SYI7_LEUMU|nr:hypothetical protein [Leucothrix mucor]
MNPQELRADQTLHSQWKDKLNTPDLIEISRNHMREKILESDRKKRLSLLLFSCFIITSAIIIIAIFSFKTNSLDSILVENIDLLSNNEEIDFYNKMEFYQWLDLATEESQ